MADRWLARLRNAPDAPSRIVVIPHAGSGPSVLRPLVQALPGGADVVGIRLPGRESRVHEPAFTSMDALVPPLLTALANDAGPPFLLLGDCSGSLIVFELARAIRRKSVPGLRAVVVVAHPPPDEARPGGPVVSVDVLDRTRALGGPGLEVLKDREMSAIARRTLVADYALTDGYCYVEEPPLDVPIVAVCGRADPMVTMESAQGWRRHTTADFELRMIEGEHFLTITRPEPLAHLAMAVANEYCA